MISSKLKIAKPATEKRKGRSAIGVGVTTLITVLVVLLLATFSVLSLVSSRSDQSLSLMAVESVTQYYEADAAAVEWYAELSDFLGAHTSSNWGDSLRTRGYTVSTEGDEVRVSAGFSMGSYRELAVSVAVLHDGSAEIRRWQTVVTVTG
jgi:predicted metalloprotease